MRGLDVAILRELLRGRVLFWGGVDPRVSSDDVARRVRAAPSTVRARLAAWSRAGILGPQAVMPNPRLLGLGLATGNVRVSSPAAKPSVAADLALLDGTTSIVDHVGEWMVTNFAYANEADVARRLALVRRLPGVAEALPCHPLVLPAPRLALAPLDRRIVESLRAGPERSFASVARELGVSARTLTRRYRRLVAGRALWFTPELDLGRWNRGVIALLNLFAAPEDVPRLAEAARAALPGHLAATLSTDLQPRDARGAAAMLVHFDGVSEAEEAACRLEAARGVEGVELLFPRAVRIFTAWARPGGA